GAGREWQRASEGGARPPVSAGPPQSILHRDYGGGAALALPEPAPAASEGEDDLDPYSKGIAEFVVTWCNHKLATRDERINVLEGEIVALKRAIREYRNELIRLKREAAGDRAEMRRERAL